jgi:hypothetical protein
LGDYGKKFSYWKTQNFDGDFSSESGSGLEAFANFARQYLPNGLRNKIKGEGK